MMDDGTATRKIICGACGERMLESKTTDAYRTTEDGGFTRFRDHHVPGSTLTHLCPACYAEWDVQTDGVRSSYP